MGADTLLVSQDSEVSRELSRVQLLLQRSLIANNKQRTHRLSAETFLLHNFIALSKPFFYRNALFPFFFFFFFFFFF